MTTQEIEESWTVKFVPFASTVPASFLVLYCKEKLDKIQLSQAPLDLTASYTVQSCRLQLQETSLGGGKSPKDRIGLSGHLQGYNTLEAFSKQDKNQLLQETFCQEFLRHTDTVYSTFLLLAFADLKNHKVLYWFAMPAMMPRPKCSIQAVREQRLDEVEWWSSDLQQELQQLAMEECPPYFMIDLSNNTSRVVNLVRDEYDKIVDKTCVIFGFFDSSPSDTAATTTTTTMGWPMRNLIAYLSLHLDKAETTVVILSYRPKRLQGEEMDDTGKNSRVLHVQVPSQQDYQWEENKDNEPHEQYKAVGWELNARSKPGPRWINLKSLMDTSHLAVQAADLNLKLMKWRMLPNLELEKLQNYKVLLIGAGTLGCSVARVLLGWGVRNLTFIDNGDVSYSNPVRQSLFTLEDCQDADKSKSGGRPKAVAAADALRTIVADANSQGVVLSIPMPGHAETRETLHESVQKLDKMMQDCDAVFLLTDTRESRWLPTVMAAVYDKPMLNAALGLDSWLVMRHGATCSDNRLGCYFCNDIVAPENSMKNRTLDQQCTVTRPGLAPLASSMAVELLVAMLHHPLQHGAPAPKAASSAFSPTVSSSQDDVSALGVMPHQIRGSLVSYTMMTPTVPAFGCCTGCSPCVLDAYRRDSTELVYQVCQSADGSYLEEISGLTAFRADAASKMVDWDDEDIDIEEDW